jgi:NCAIR mutase (PurE)-related protein
MHPESLKKLLEMVKSGKVDVAEAMNKLRAMPFTDIGFAKLDTHRNIRRGCPEVIYCEGKTISQIKGIFRELVKHQDNIIATRASEDVFRNLKKNFKKINYSKDARIITLIQKPVKKEGLVIVVSAGTSDIPVAEEACITAELMGSNVERLYDVGVAGIHRLLAHTELLHKASVLVVVAGMEGALPSVVGGLVDKPVIAVPTSVGYGANLGGIAPLLGMLNSCSSGVVVVNIDNGFGAGYAAGLINRMKKREGAE